MVAVDPFNYFGASHIISDRVKELTAGKLHYALWKLHSYRRAPAPNILLGDSRMDVIDTMRVRELTNVRYANLAYGGGTPVEAVDTYWLTSRVTHLNAVYLEMGIINFNAFQKLNRVGDVTAMDGKPLNYLSSRLVLRASILASYVAATGDTVRVEAPSLGKDAFWHFQIDKAMPQLLHQYAYPLDIAKKLAAVAADCRRRGTRFVIVIPPTHIDVQRKVSALGRDADVRKFKAFVRSLGTVYDFDYPNPLTRDSSKFRDPFHLKDSNIIIDEIWGATRGYAQVTTHSQPREAK